MDPPAKHRSHLFSTVVGLVGLLILLDVFRSRFHLGGGSITGWAIRALIVLAVARVLFTIVTAALTRPPRAPVHPNPPTARPSPRGGHLEPPPTPAALARQRIQRAGGGAYLGVSLSGEWLTANPRHQVGVIGAPQSGKSTGFIVPGVAGSSGAVISASTKPDVMQATVRARSEIGQAWLFDPAGEQNVLPDGVRRLHWSPVAAAVTWDEALLMADAMTAAARPGTGTTDSSHWTERAQALLAPLLYAANQSARTIGDVLEWILHKDLEPALEVLADCDAQMAAAVLTGIEGTDSREKSSIFSATAGVLAAYRSDAVRRSAAEPNFDAVRFAGSADTIYITSHEQYQRLAAPLIVGMLEQVRQAVYTLVAREEMPTVMQWFLDEFTNIAPIADPLALLSQAGGQMLHIELGFQDIPQIRARYGEPVADAFLTLLQTIVLLPGNRDTRTLEAISLAFGEFDREMTSQSLGRSEPQEWLTSATESDTVSYQTQRQRVLTPGDIAGLPKGHALLLQGMDWQLVQVTNWRETEPWLTIAGPDAL